jgi:hypothetical protein
MVWVEKANKAVGAYQIQVEFNDGRSGIADFKNTLENDHRAIMRELLDLSVFNSFKVDNDTVCWKNGVDFSPEFIYNMI